MYEEFIYPCELIPQDSIVVIYGGGMFGKFICEKNNEIKWNSIKYVVDVNYKAIRNCPVEVKDVDYLLEDDLYDYVFVAIIDRKLINQVVKTLMAKGIPEDKILYRKTDRDFNDEYADIYLTSKNAESDRLEIGMCLGEPIGDQVIFLKVYQAITDICADVNMYLFCKNIGITKSVYYGQENLKHVYDHMPTYDEFIRFDLFLYSGFIPRMGVYNKKRIKEKSLELYRRLENLYRYQLESSPGNGVPVFQSRILLDRAKFDKKNRYTLLGVNGVFDIEDTRVNLYLDKSYFYKFRALKLSSRYITIHYGASDVLNNGKEQTKIWPLEYCEQLCQMIKGFDSTLEIVQLGGEHDSIIQSADRTVLGESLEISKYVLKRAIAHIDCESGLVHVATQIGTKCFVVFGPTPRWFFGYESNCNFDPSVCGECKGLVKDWYTHCLRYKRPECMYSTKPERVFRELVRYLKGEMNNE